LYSNNCGRPEAVYKRLAIILSFHPKKVLNHFDFDQTADRPPFLPEGPQCSLCFPLAMLFLHQIANRKAIYSDTFALTSFYL
jgi:hypothetical protein